ncbi:hypothetical protein DFJ43DRAFT_1041502 [Lentinula guzmanii]|uniref:Uncharacterized protein n=1 Tax=Lentinula guzmanii TaxID=2804957 RepID=A0AA38MXK3_9AGAR|nr:hypothetical protein DFJ43DRAFT_1041502 [Lentinula guzmanii]
MRETRVEANDHTRTVKRTYSLSDIVDLPPKQSGHLARKYSLGRVRGGAEKLAERWCFGDPSDPSSSSSSELDAAGGSSLQQSKEAHVPKMTESTDFAVAILSPTKLWYLVISAKRVAWQSPKREGPQPDWGIKAHKERDLAPPAEQQQGDTGKLINRYVLALLKSLTYANSRMWKTVSLSEHLVIRQENQSLSSRVPSTWSRDMGRRRTTARPLVPVNAGQLSLSHTIVHLPCFENQPIVFLIR